MNYLVPGEVLARLLIAAGSRLDADEIGELVHRIKAEVSPSAEQIGAAAAAEFLPPAKPE